MKKNLAETKDPSQAISTVSSKFFMLKRNAKRETVETTRFTSNFFWETNFWMTTGSRRILLTIWFSDKVFFLSSSNCKCCWAIFASANWSSSCLCLNTFSTCFKGIKREKSYMCLCPYSLVLFRHKKTKIYNYTALTPSSVQADL